MASGTTACPCALMWRRREEEPDVCPDCVGDWLCGGCALELGLPEAPQEDPFDDQEDADTLTLTFRARAQDASLCREISFFFPSNASNSPPPPHTHTHTPSHFSLESYCECFVFKTLLVYSLSLLGGAWPLSAVHGQLDVRFVRVHAGRALVA